VTVSRLLAEALVRAADRLAALTAH
jgi:hypothetical protein